STGALTPVKVGYTTIIVAFAGNENWKAVSETVGVTVSGSTATVTASDLMTLKLSDEPKQIQAEVDPVDAGALVYMIEDETIATVDGEGYVTPVKARTTKATVMSVASDEYASGIKEINITVQRGTPTLDVTPVNVAMGTTGQLTITGPEGVNSFTYSSADTSIVEVDSTGKLTPKSTGDATINITSAKTDNWEQGTATATVRVTKGTPTITADDITIPVGDTDESVGATTNGGTLSFESKNTAVVIVDSDGKLTPIETGTAQIEITAASSDDWNAGTKTITVTVVTGKPIITAEDVTVAMGNSATIAATVNKDAGTLSYTSKNPNVVTVDPATGALTPVHTGTATVTISCAKSAHWEAATKDITVTVQKGIPTITAANVSVAMGAEVTIEASASIGAGALSYTSQTTSVVKVDEATGKITPVKVGTANVLVASAATDDWAEGTAIVKVEVTKGKSTITVANTSVGIGKTASLGAKLNDGAVSGTLTYTSRNENVVTVSTSGVLTPVAVGTATVQIAFNGNTNWNAVTNEVTVTVTPGAATITAEDVSLAMGTTEKIFPIVEGGGTPHFESKNTAVVTVDGSGNLTPVKVGTAKVDITSAETSTHGAGSKTITVTVTKGTPTVTADNVTVTMGGTATITPTASSGTKSFTFTSANTGIATVSSSGVVTPKAGGPTTITVTSKSDTNWNSASKVITVTVNRGTPTISAGNKSVTMGSTVSLGATTNGGPLSYKSSKESVATVSATGVVTPKGAGTAVITITSSQTDSWASVSKTVTVTVLKATPTISMSNKTVVMGKTVSMGATVSKGGGGITYTSKDESVAKVDEYTGVVTPVSAGTVTITAISAPTAGYQSAQKTATVTVTEGVPVITAANLTLVYGTKGKKVTATVNSGANTSLTYTSSKPAVVTVNARTGELTAVKAGTSYITISAPAVSGKWKAVAKKIRVKITKAPQTITSKTKDITVSYSTSAQTPDVAAVTGTAPGDKISYTRSAGSSKIKINKKTGKITVAKKTKKGKYTITAKITAKATAQYKKATKKVKFTVTVK
ncbi:MAG: Ig-like domain-containing protein, partial [Atopobiaceae bacterium]|nr:Ig-like domain-containing protein [Atopobiaceae bacterium]